jgi:hypothetical protein
VSENRSWGSSALPLPLITLLRVVAAVLVGALTVALSSAIGVPGVLMLAGVLGSFAFVGLTVSRRRPVGTD